MDSNTFKQLNLITSQGLNVAELDGRLFIYTNWVASFNSSSTSQDTCEFRGVEVTEFLTLQHIVHNPTAFFQKLTQFLDTVKPMKILFNKFTSVYYLYSA